MSNNAGASNDLGVDALERNSKPGKNPMVRRTNGF
jgi:hypothetical protein